MKNLAEALAECDSKIDEVKFVMQILKQLTPSYHNIIDLITNTKPSSLFLEAKNMRLLHESRKESIDLTGLCYNYVLRYVVLFVSTNGKSKNKFNKGENNWRFASDGR